MACIHQSQSIGNTNIKLSYSPTYKSMVEATKQGTPLLMKFIDHMQECMNEMKMAMEGKKPKI
jgi:hypothetical protein